MAEALNAKLPPALLAGRPREPTWLLGLRKGRASPDHGWAPEGCTVRVLAWNHWYHSEKKPSRDLPEVPALMQEWLEGWFVLPTESLTHFTTFFISIFFLARCWQANERLDKRRRWAQPVVKIPQNVPSRPPWERHGGSSEHRGPPGRAPGRSSARLRSWDLVSGQNLSRWAGLGSAMLPFQ